MHINFDFSLGPDDLHDVKSAVISLASKYNALGLALKLKPSALDEIKSNNPKSGDALQEALKMWLERSNLVKAVKLPSWRSLVIAVADPAGGSNPALADKIAAEHPGIVQC